MLFCRKIVIRNLRIFRCEFVLQNVWKITNTRYAWQVICSCGKKIRQIYFKFQTNSFQNWDKYYSKLIPIQYLIRWFVVVAQGRGSIWRAGLACRERPHVVQTSPPDQLGQVCLSVNIRIYSYTSIHCLFLCISLFFCHTF